MGVQRARCRRYVDERGWNLEPEHEYQDVITGSRDARPGYQSLLSAVRGFQSAAPRSDVPRVAVVVAQLDRLGRHLQEALRCRAELQALGVEIHSVSEGGVVPAFVANILASMAQEEVHRGGARVHTVLRNLYEQGWNAGGATPWGYRRHQLHVQNGPTEHLGPYSTSIPKPRRACPRCLCSGQAAQV
jgi:DNA invertase Pin-like site-specific DNA recombinase